MGDRSKEAINWAQKGAANAPDEFRVAAFQELLRHRLSDHSQISENPLQVDSAPPGAPVIVPDRLSQVFAKLPEPHIAADGNRKQQAAWAVVELQRRGQEATVESVMEMIQETLGVTPSERTISSRTLRRLTPQYLSRTKVGKAYIYTSTRHVIDLFTSMEEPNP